MLKTLNMYIIYGPQFVHFLTTCFGIHLFVNKLRRGLKKALKIRFDPFIVN